MLEAHQHPSVLRHMFLFFYLLVKSLEMSGSDISMPRDATDIVFVVEMTPNFKPHFNDIKDAYIKPILE